MTERPFDATTVRELFAQVVGRCAATNFFPVDRDGKTTMDTDRAVDIIYAAMARYGELDGAQ